MDNSERPEGTRIDLLPPSMMDQDTKEPRFKTQDKTLYILNSGILPHSNHERDEMAELLKLARNSKGILIHTDRIANYHISDEPVPITHAQIMAQQLGFDVNKELRDAKTHEVRFGVVTKKADQMLGYVEDSQDKLSTMSSLQNILNEADDEELSSKLLDNLGAVDLRAILNLVRFYEVKDYATDPHAQESRMDAQLSVQGFEAIKDYIKANLGSRTVIEVKNDVAEYLKLERGRKIFWQDHLVGHKAQPAASGKPTVRERIGLVDSPKYDLNARIRDKLAAIASGGFPTELSDKEE